MSPSTEVTTPRKAKAAASRSPRTPTKSNATNAATPNGEGVTKAEASSPTNRKLTPAVRKAILALKIRGTSTKDIATRLGANYKTVWKFLDKEGKRRAQFGPNTDTETLSETDKKDAALVLKLAGCTTRQIANELGMNYKTLWKFFDQYQKAAGLPDVLQDPEM